MFDTHLHDPRDVWASITELQSVQARLFSFCSDTISQTYKFHYLQLYLNKFIKYLHNYYLSFSRLFRSQRVLFQQRLIIDRSAGPLHLHFLLWQLKMQLKCGLRACIRCVFISCSVLTPLRQGLFRDIAVIFRTIYRRAVPSLRLLRHIRALPILR
jgi:hypothetical protein